MPNVFVSNYEYAAQGELLALGVAENDTLRESFQEKHPDIQSSGPALKSRPTQTAFEKVTL